MCQLTLLSFLLHCSLNTIFRTKGASNSFGTSCGLFFPKTVVDAIDTSIATTAPSVVYHMYDILKSGKTSL